MNTQCNVPALHHITSVGHVVAFLMHDYCIKKKLLIACNIGKFHYDVTGPHRLDVCLMIMHNCRERKTLNLTVF